MSLLPDPSAPRRRGTRTVRIRIVAGTAGGLALVGGLGTLPAAAEPVRQVQATVVDLAVDPAAGDAAEPQTVTMLDVAGALVDWPEGVAMPAVEGGDRVELTVRTDAVGDAADVVRAADAASVQSVEVVASTSAAATLAAGAHLLTVLPVWFSGADSTPSALPAAVAQAAGFWTAQTGGLISVTADVRPAQRVAAPSGCDIDAVYAEAMAANGLTTLRDRQHVLVYFPDLLGCGWAGLASVGGQQILVSGAPYADVVAHEFGHNLGLGHANAATLCSSAAVRVPLTLPLQTCTLQEYGDYADVMGPSLRRAPGSVTSAMGEYLGIAQVYWATAGVAAEVDLAPLSSVGSTQAVAVPVSGGAVFVDYRPAVGTDGERVPAWAGVQVHYRPDGQTPATYLLDMSPDSGWSTASPVALAAGETWQVPGTSTWVTVRAVGSTANVIVGPQVTSAEQRYVVRVYHDLFGRGVDSSGLTTWVGGLLAGLPRSAVADGITSSDEYRMGLISSAYGTFLGRAPDSSGLAFWLDRMRGGMTIDALEVGFLTSPEAYAAAGSNDVGWVGSLYRQILGRSPSADELAWWTARMAGGMGREAVARGFVLSTEHLSAVVDGHYQRLLGRGLDPVGLQTWVTALQTGTRLESVIAGIVGSDEYWSHS